MNYARRFAVACATPLFGISLLMLFAINEQSASAAPRVLAVKPEAAPDPTEEPRERNDPATPVKSEKVKHITFDAIKFEMEKTDPYERALIGPKIEALTGKRIRIRGYVLPSYSKVMRTFVLMRDNEECCFGPGAALYDCIIVTMKPEKTAQFTTSPITVEGVFRIEEQDDPIDPDANPQAIYQLEADAVER